MKIPNTFKTFKTFKTYHFFQPFKLGWKNGVWPLEKRLFHDMHTINLIEEVNLNELETLLGDSIFELFP